MEDVTQANYDVLKEQQTKFEEMHERVEAMLQKLAQAAEPLNAGSWQGQGAEAFKREVSEEVEPALKRLYEALEEAGSTLGQIAQKIHAADEASSQVLRSLFGR
ncbi:MAG: WXG100 family type VII secretion target [Chloroflexota bacterium]